MNYKNIHNNPFEMLRLKHGISQIVFSKKLGYSNVPQYAYNMKEFTGDIILKVKEKYEIDLTMDIIAYLKYVVKTSKPIKEPKTKPVNVKGTGGISDLFATIN